MVPSRLLLSTAKAVRRLWCRKQFYRLNALLATARISKSRLREGGELSRRRDGVKVGAETRCHDAAIQAGSS